MKTTKFDFYSKYQKTFEVFISRALDEDIGRGDYSSLACIDSNAIQEAELIVKQNCVIAGSVLAEAIFKQHDPELKLNIEKNDGSICERGTRIFVVSGRAQSILATERLVLNCMQRMSGISTLTHALVRKIAHTQCVILDTRKTAPNFRLPQKWAVAIGGGSNHRMGLYDALMIKDNHIDYCGGIEIALQKTKAYLTKINEELPVIVETRNKAEVMQALKFPWITRILLDNMDTTTLRECVRLINGHIPTEASGNIDEKNLIAIAETGVNFVSLGALTHSAPSIDLSLKAKSG